MSIHNIIIKSFKSFSTKQDSISITFDASFIVLVGRNGCGKSAIIDAIMFCLFNKNDGRSSMNNLINATDRSTHDIKSCSVVVNMHSREDKDIRLEVTRAYNGETKTNKTKLIAKLVNNNGTRVIHTEDDLTAALIDKFNIHSDNLQRQFVSQNSLALIASKSPDQLLLFLEDCIGTLKIKESIETHEILIQQIGSALRNMEIENEVLVQSGQILLPMVEMRRSTLIEEKKIYESYTRFYEIRIKESCRNRQDAEIQIAAALGEVGTLKHKIKEGNKRKKGLSALLDEMSLIDVSYRARIATAQAMSRKLSKSIESKTDKTNMIVNDASSNKKRIATQARIISSTTNMLQMKELELNDINTSLNQISKEKTQLLSQITSNYSKFSVDTITKVLNSKNIVKSQKTMMSMVQAAIVDKEKMILELEKYKDSKSRQLKLYNDDVDSCKLSVADIDTRLLRIEADITLGHINLSRLTSEQSDKSAALTRKLIEIEEVKSSKWMYLLSEKCRGPTASSKLLEPLSSNLEDLVGPLHTMIKPKSGKYALPLLSLLNDLLSTIVVRRRLDAIKGSAIAKKMHISYVTFIILNEYQSDCKPNDISIKSKLFTSIYDCFEILNDDVGPMLKQRFSKWLLYHGNIDGLLRATVPRLNESSKAGTFNVVTLEDGCRLMHDGEIITSNKLGMLWPVSYVVTSNCDIDTDRILPLLHPNDIPKFEKETKQTENELKSLESYIADCNFQRTSLIIERESIVNRQQELCTCINTVRQDNETGAINKKINSIKSDLARDKKQLLQHEEESQVQLVLVEDDDNAEQLRLLTRIADIDADGDRSLFRINILKSELSSLKRKLVSCTDSKKAAEETQQDCNLQSQLDELNMQLTLLIEQKQMCDEDFSSYKFRYMIQTSSLVSTKSDLKIVSSELIRYATKLKLMEEKTSRQQASLIVINQGLTRDMDQKLLCETELRKPMIEFNVLKMSIFSAGVTDASSNCFSQTCKSFSSYSRSSDCDSSSNCTSTQSNDRECDENDLHVWEKQLIRKKNNLANKEAAINYEHVTLYDELFDKQVRLIRKVQEQQSSLMTIQCEVNAMKEKRFLELTTSLDVINKKINKVYQQLVADSDCHLSYTTNCISLMKDGVKVFVSNKNQQYQESKELSGGQKSVVSIAILLSVQSLQHGGTFIFDEVDAALDSRTVCRLGRVIKERSSNSNFLIISHRQEMIDQAFKIIALYTYGDTSDVVTVAF